MHPPPKAAVPADHRDFRPGREAEGAKLKGGIDLVRTGVFLNLLGECLYMVVGWVAWVGTLLKWVMHFNGEIERASQLATIYLPEMVLVGLKLYRVLKLCTGARK